MQHQSVYTATPWFSYSTCMLSEQPGQEISNNPKSEIDPDEPMVYQIRVKLGNYGPKRTY
jgi:hypothetical protein